MLVFLGGTCGNNQWRVPFIASLVKAGVPSETLFNPVVPDWTRAAQILEEEMKAKATHELYYIGNPMLEGCNISAASLMEATMGLYDKPATTVVVFDDSGFSNHVLKAMNQCERVLRARFPDANILGSLEEAKCFLTAEYYTGH